MGVQSSIKLYLIIIVYNIWLKSVYVQRFTHVDHKLFRLDGLKIMLRT